MEATEGKLKVLLLPWLAHGHISPFLELAQKLSDRNFHVYFCSSAINLDYTKKRLDQKSSNLSIEFVELHLPDTPELPPHHHTTKGLPPHLLRKLINAFQNAKPSFCKIMKSLDFDLLIFDGFQTWGPTLASSYGIPSVLFSTSGSASMSFFYHLVTSYGESKRGNYPFSEIYLSLNEFKKLKSSAASKIDDFEDIPLVKLFEMSSEIVLIKSCKEIEGKYLDYLSLLCGKKAVPLGPLIQDSSNTVKDDKEEEGCLDIIKWLEKKEESSVIFVSFGSEYFLTKEERDEIAYGLEISNVNFIWVLRFPEGESIDIEEALPEGFLGRVKNRGFMVDGWAPQVKVLNHSSTGGFVSHCGWSSIMESLYFGVPIIAMPMGLDQLTNGRFVVAINGGFEVLKDEKGDFKREEIAKAMKQLMFEKDGEIVRRKTKEVSEKIRMKEVEEMDEAIDELRHLCFKKQQGIGTSILCRRSSTADAAVTRNDTVLSRNDTVSI